MLHTHTQTQQYSSSKTNTRNTWKTINTIISKSPPKKQCPTFFRDGQKEITENCEIANKFNTLFTHIGPDQSKNINYTGDKTYGTVEPLIYDPPHERPPAIYDHISCNGYGKHTVYVSTLVNDHPANATSDRVV